MAARDALATVLDATTQYAIIGTDADGLITVFNGGAERMLGYRAADVVGRHHPELFHDPEELERLAAEFGIPVESVLGHGTRRQRHGHARLDARAQRRREAAGVARDHGDPRRRRDAHRLPRHRPRHHGRAPGCARELREAEERFRNAFDQAPIGKALVSPDGRFTRVNSALCGILGYSEQRLLDTTFQTLTHPDDLEADLEQMQRMLAGESESYAMEKRYQHADGHYIWALLSVSLVRDEAGAPLYFVSQIQDISEQKLIAERLTDLTLHDALTGLANRVLFADRLAHAVERSRRSKERVAVLFIDLDRFKGVNDSLGHAAGDELLRQAGERMRRAVRPADTIARLGGDEFTVLCEDLGAVNDAGWVADRLSDTLERPFDLFGTEISIGVSIGIAVADRPTTAPRRCWPRPTPRCTARRTTGASGKAPREALRLRRCPRWRRLSAERPTSRGRAPRPLGVLRHRIHTSRQADRALPGPALRLHRRDPAWRLGPQLRPRDRPDGRDDRPPGPGPPPRVPRGAGGAAGGPPGAGRGGGGRGRGGGGPGPRGGGAAGGAGAGAGRPCGTLGSHEPRRRAAPRGGAYRVARPMAATPVLPRHGDGHRRHQVDRHEQPRAGTARTDSPSWVNDGGVSVTLRCVERPRLRRVDASCYPQRAGAARASATELDVELGLAACCAVGRLPTTAGTAAGRGCAGRRARGSRRRRPRSGAGTGRAGCPSRRTPSAPAGTSPSTSEGSIRPSATRQMCSHESPRSNS